MVRGSDPSYSSISLASKMQGRPVIFQMKKLGPREYGASASYCCVTLKLSGLTHKSIFLFPILWARTLYKAQQCCLRTVPCGIGQTGGTRASATHLGAWGQLLAFCLAAGQPGLYTVAQDGKRAKGLSPELEQRTLSVSFCWFKPDFRPYSRGGKH